MNIGVIIFDKYLRLAVLEGSIACATSLPVLSFHLYLEKIHRSLLLFGKAGIE
jgi:hypothetical protein